jgi:hypothetical protein
MRTYLSTYLGMYLLTYEKNGSSNVVIHVDKKIHGRSRKHVKSISYHIVLHISVVV